MSTPNFYFKNICVVIEEDKWYDEINEDIAENLAYEIKRFERGGRLGSENRSYPQNVLGYINYDKKDGEHYARIYITLNPGYYTDACLDYVIEREHEMGGEGKEVKYLEKDIERMETKVKKLLRKMGTEVVKVAQFSNGEAVYKVKKNK